ncbi:hypothetical protein ACS127_10780 [Amphibacillus sp. Q70]|uniref:hypothetical protein n=1 Tax=Amphibacillus sp. Q70 TaxID=3453416 RepID=UPI003F83DF2C
MYKRFIYLAGFQALLFVVFVLMMIFEYGINLMTLSVIVILIVGIALNLLLYSYFKKIAEHQKQNEDNLPTDEK